MTSVLIGTVVSDAQLLIDPSNSIDIVIFAKMEDIFQWCREGNAMQIRVWLDDTEHDMNQGYTSFLFWLRSYVSRLCQSSDVRLGFKLCSDLETT